MVEQMRCSFRTLEEGEGVSTFLAWFFPRPEEVISGVSELFLNAVEHGNLAISYERRAICSRKRAGKKRSAEDYKILIGVNESFPLFLKEKRTLRASG